MRHILLFALGLCCGTAPLAAAEPLKLLTEPYPPYNFQQDGKIRGAAADQVHAMMKAANISYTMQILPWARAYVMARHEANTCIFSTTHTPERDKLFQWVEPLGGGAVVLIRKAGSGVAPKTLEEARSYSVGVQRGDYAADYLTRKGFKKLDFAADINLTLNKLINGRIDLATTSEAAYQAGVAKGQPLEIALAMPVATFSLACSHDISRNIIALLQMVLNQLILDGTQDRLYVQYGMPPQNMQSLVKKTD